MSSQYEALGVSATKADVHAAVATLDRGLYPGAFCRLGPDVLAGDPAWCAAAHADGAGTKAQAAYLLYRQTHDPACFAGLAQDALVMNLDDLLCVGAVGPFLLTNNLARNSRYIPGEVITSILAGYQRCLELLDRQGITVAWTGGETADLGDAVRTLVVDATLTTRLPRARVVDNDRIAVGDVIVGLSSTGQLVGEDRPNSGIGSNGLTLARHVLLKKDYLHRHPESVAPETDPGLVYRGPFDLLDQPAGLEMSVGAALLSPTRSYAPIIKEVLEQCGPEVHGMVHCTGGGQAKCKGFGRGIRYIKDRLFPTPPIHQLIMTTGGIAPKEMHQTFNMGHRFEIILPEHRADLVIQVARRWGITARIVGHCEASNAAPNEVRLHTSTGLIEY